MRRPTIAYMDNGLPVQCLSERDFLFPDADEKYVPDTRAYIQSYDVPAFHALLRAGSPEDAIAAFPHLSDREKTFALRGLFENWTKELAGVHRRPRYGTSMPGRGPSTPSRIMHAIDFWGVIG